MKIYANQSRAMTAWRATSKDYEQQQQQQQEAGSSSNNLVAATPATSRHCNLHLIVVIILACCTRWLYGLPDGRATCRSVPGLTKDQVELCYKASDVTAAALEGLDMAIRECQIQNLRQSLDKEKKLFLQYLETNQILTPEEEKKYERSKIASRWKWGGCSHNMDFGVEYSKLFLDCREKAGDIQSKINLHNNHAGRINLRQSLDKEKKLFLQYLETNQILTPEEEKKYERSKIASRWKWGGCSHNMDFGVEYSKLFLDCREKAGDIQSKINLHNNHAGRIAVSNNMEFRCKCHGMSGSCQLKTCWKSAPDFHIVGKVLKHQFRKAILVDQSNLGNGEPKSNGGSSSGSSSPDLDTADASGGHDGGGTGSSESRRHEELGVERGSRQPSADKNAARMARKLETSLFYYQRSPNFCTVGRKCNRNTTTSDGCTSLCCGRGHSQMIQRRAERCHCKFQWCCNVECEECHIYEEIAQGVNAKVFRAKELENDRIVALKIQHYDEEHQVSIEEEYRTLRDYCDHPNLPEFYGVYKLSKPNGPDEIWFVMEHCAGGTAVDMVNKLLKLDRRMREEHIAYIIRETCRAAIELNRNHVLHRDIRGDNILLTKNGRVKLCDFGLSRQVVAAMESRDPDITVRADVWALGITTIELADGKPPFADMHPTRAMFQIIRNPPPTLMRPTNWSQQINDFISETLEKNAENRPMMDVKTLYKEPELFVDRGYVKRFDEKPERMYPEDLAALENPVDESIIESLRHRIIMGGSYSFIGDILLSLNSNEIKDEFPPEFHAKYRFKSRSENQPHIFSVADIAYQDMLHHKEPQHIVLSGESYSGKSTNARLLIKHLCYLGSGNRGATGRVESSINAILMLNQLKEYNLKADRNYRYLRVPPEVLPSKLKYRRDDPEGNVEKYKEFENILRDIDFNHKQLETVRKVLSAILNIGNIRFRQNGKAFAGGREEIYVVPDQFIMVKGGIAERRQYTSEEARDARDAVASTLYSRLVDFIINRINMNMSFPRACFNRNGLEQLMINTLNEQMQYHYNQRIFISEMLEMEAEDIDTVNLNFYDNKTALDNLLTKPDGLFYIIDDASRSCQDQDLIMDRVSEKHSQFVKKHTATEISVAHYTGRIIYDTRAFTDINRDFVPPEMIETFRSSLDESIMAMFTNQLTKAGNLTMPFEAALNTLSAGCISQVNNLRTLAANFRFTCLTLLKMLSQNANLGVHFVRCIRADLEYKPRAFHSDVVQQQMKALGVLDTMEVGKKGQEHQDVAACKIQKGKKTQVDRLKEFDEEHIDISETPSEAEEMFLEARMDEALAAVRISKIEQASPLTFRGFRDRVRLPPLVNEKSGQLNENTADFIRPFAKKWREKSIFQVLLHYRAARFQDFVNLSQQVHIYNQRMVAGLNKCTRAVPFERINMREVNSSQLGPLPVPIKKMPFRLDQIPFYDTQYMTFPNQLLTQHMEDDEPWDSPLQRNPSMTSCALTYNAYKKEQACQTNWDRMGESDNIYNQGYFRDPQQLRRNQMQMNMNAYNNAYNSYSTNYNSSGNQNWGVHRSGSRRNSLKGYAAPAPPPPPMPSSNYYRNNPNQQQRNYQQRSSYPPSDPNSEDPPFNFKAMLRKTNYPRGSETSTYDFNNRRESDSGQQHTFQAPKLRSTGRRFQEDEGYNSSSGNYGVSRNFGQQQRAPTLRQAPASVGRSFEDSNARSFEEAGSYVEEEIAPGVTLSGYAVDI
ncbi:hypothetical protein M5D96_003162 [Drosophila gunungcola]|uniref:Protein Wnt n=1 Tax=Drosophila gunungcola TaxID=103775 RepID=A0A9Q0BRB9_9MUSC|nr:hypothetical protein M5D96_003162 [Drosophila gunungcola]